MRVWRIARQPYAASALAGLGGLHVAGRWHHRGVPVVYAASSAALAALEVLVHTDPLLAPADLRLLALDVPDDAARDRLDLDALPPDWRDLPPPRSTQALGTAWLRDARSLVLDVPSAVIPSEANALLNPAHPDISRCRIALDQPFSFDPRLRP